MKPLGRKQCRYPKGKWHIKHNGENIPAWWEDVCTPSKSLEKRLVQKEIEEGEELYYAYLEDDLDEECGGYENR